MKDNPSDEDEGASEDYFLVPADESVIELKVSGSKFIATVMEVNSEAEAGVRLVELKRSTHDATHHCTAFRVGIDPTLERFNDDGEPSGTAGPPILRRLEAASLTNVLLVVTRYYGGTKLGTGGLIRAYGDSAQSAIEAAGSTRRVVECQFVTQFDYSDTAIVMHLLDRYGARIVATEYGDMTRIEFAVRRSLANQLPGAFLEASAGKVRAVRAATE